MFDNPTARKPLSTGGVGSEQAIIGTDVVVSDLSGPTGVKMLGPYAYTPPIYWYEDTERGGAYGFNTETGPGAQAVVTPHPRREQFLRTVRRATEIGNGGLDQRSRGRNRRCAGLSEHFDESAIADHHLVV